MNFSSDRIESRLKRVWMWKSANALASGGGAPVRSLVASMAPAAAAPCAAVGAWAVTGWPSRAAHQALAEGSEVLEGKPRAHRHRVQRVLRHVARDAGHLGEHGVQVAQQRAAAGHDHALVDDVAGQLGGVCSRTLRTAVMTCCSGCSIASVISVEVIGMVRGRPAIMSRPLTSMVSGSSIGRAEPMAIFTSSAVRSPIMRLYLRRM